MSREPWVQKIFDRVDEEAEYDQRVKRFLDRVEMRNREQKEIERGWLEELNMTRWSRIKRWLRL